MISEKTDLDFASSGIFLEGPYPINCFKELLQEEISSGNFLLIHTDLNLLDLDFLTKYADLFRWHFKDSQRSLLTSTISNSQYEFSYWNRIHEYFKVDQLKQAIQELHDNKQCRPISTWSPNEDLLASGIIPCLMTLQFSKVEDQLNLTVVFRSRDIIRRMIPNWNALKILQQQTADTLKLRMGSLYDVSLKWFYKDLDLVKLSEIL